MLVKELVGQVRGHQDRGIHCTENKLVDMAHNYLFLSDSLNKILCCQIRGVFLCAPRNK